MSRVISRCTSPSALNAALSCKTRPAVPRESASDARTVASSFRMSATSETSVLSRLNRPSDVLDDADERAHGVGARHHHPCPRAQRAVHDTAQRPVAVGHSATKAGQLRRRRLHRAALGPCRLHQGADGPARRASMSIAIDLTLPTIAGSSFVAAPNWAVVDFDVGLRLRANCVAVANRRRRGRPGGQIHHHRSDQRAARPDLRDRRRDASPRDTSPGPPSRPGRRAVVSLSLGDRKRMSATLPIFCPHQPDLGALEDPARRPDQRRTGGYGRRAARRPGRTSGSPRRCRRSRRWR